MLCVRARAYACCRFTHPKLNLCFFCRQVRRSGRHSLRVADCLHVYKLSLWLFSGEEGEMMVVRIPLSGRVILKLWRLARLEQQSFGKGFGDLGDYETCMAVGLLPALFFSASSRWATHTSQWPSLAGPLARYCWADTLKLGPASAVGLCAPQGCDERTMPGAISWILSKLLNVSSTIALMLVSSIRHCHIVTLSLVIAARCRSPAHRRADSLREPAPAEHGRRGHRRAPLPPPRPRRPGFARPRAAPQKLKPLLGLRVCGCVCTCMWGVCVCVCRWHFPLFSHP